jgi:hypothetical protein
MRNFKILLSFMLVFLQASFALAGYETGAPNSVLRVPNAGGRPIYGAVDLTKAASVTGILGHANGGTDVSAAGTAGNLLISNGTSWTSTSDQSSLALKNISFTLSAGASALTIAVKQADGTSDCSSTTPCLVAVKSSSATASTYNLRSITGALSLVIPSGATLGSVSTTAQDYWVYLQDNSGTLELAVSATRYQEGTSQTTTTISAGATSGSAIYATTGRSTMFLRTLGTFNLTESTAGTWATATANSLAQGGALHGSSSTTQVSSTATVTGTATATNDVTVVDGTSGSFTVTLPSAVGITGVVKTIVRKDNTLANIISLATAGGQTIGAIASPVHLATLNESWRLISDGTNWQILSHKTDTDWFACTIADPTSSASHIFTISASTVTGGDVYSNNGQTFTVSITSVSTTMTTAGSGAPLASGTLTKVSGSGPSTIAYSAVTTSKPAKGSAVVITDTVRCRRSGREIQIHRLYRQTTTSGATAGTGDWVDWTPTGVTIDQTSTTGCTSYANVTAANSYIEDAPNAALVSANCTASGIVTSAAIYFNIAMAASLGPNTYRLFGLLNIATSIDYPHTIGQVNYTTANWVWNSMARLPVVNWEP